MALPQRHRLKGQRTFDCLYRQGRAVHGPFLMLRWSEAQPELLPPTQRRHSDISWRLGVVVSAKVHKRAVQRNRLRRLLHSHLLNQPPLPRARPLWLLLSLKPGAAERDATALLGECDELFQRAGLCR